MKHIGHDQDGISFASTTDSEPDYLIIMSSHADYRAPWDDWCEDTIELFRRKWGFVTRRRGPAVELYHPQFCN